MGSRAKYHRDRRYKMKHAADIARATPRTCAEPGCDVVLNSYNRNPCCSIHNFAYAKRNRTIID